MSRDPARFLSRRERRTAARLLEVAIPPLGVLPVGGPDVLDRMEQIVSAGGMPATAGYRGMLWTLEGLTVARFGQRFSHLSPERRTRALHALERRKGVHHLVRTLLIPLKAAFFDDPELYAALGCRYDPEPARDEEPAWRANVMDGTELVSDEPMECDVVIVGTGAGGAPLAHALASRGHTVLMLEEGAYFSRSDFNGRPMEMLDELYRDHSLTVTVGNTVIPVPTGKTVGGTTTVNSGTCFRLPASTLAHWRDDHGLVDFTSDEMDRWYTSVEQMLEVTPAEMRWVGKPGAVIARGCDALGYSHRPLQRNAPDCDGQGLCCFGCPTDAKRSTNVSYVPAALQQNAFVATGVRVDEVIVEGGRAVGVRGVAVGGGRVTVRARVVVLSCGTFGTPGLLLRQRLANGSGQVGRNLSLHPATHAAARFDERIDGWNTIPQGYEIDEFAEEGIRFEGATVPLELFAAGLESFGVDYARCLEQFPYFSLFGFMIKDSSRGRVVLDTAGRPQPLYWMNRSDAKLLRRGMAILCRVFLAAGAREVRPGLIRYPPVRSVAEADALERAHLPPRRFTLSAYHPLGTARMGLDPGRSVVGPSHETHDVRNLFVCDGSALPSALGVNPQVTIMALSTRAAGFVERRLV